uniref:Uncharacterized protein n=1 Tax=viral metagenome TaxID=1070528 RepID=A0A6C0IV31_9ZZZZ
MSSRIYQSRFSQPIGAGGFASHTASAFETNPVRYHNQEGVSLSFPTDGTYRPHHFEVVESFRRNPDKFLNTSFRLAFSKPLHSVRSIELMELNIPNVAATPPAHREYLLLFGLYNGVTGLFEPQRNLHHNGPYHSMISDDHYDPSVDRTTNPAWSFALSTPLCDYAIFRGHYDSAAVLQWADVSDFRRTMFFPSPIDLAYLEFTLMDPLGNLYDMDPADEWSTTLQIDSQQ